MSYTDTRISFTQNFACGGMAGLVSRTLTAPLDVLKIRIQVGMPESKKGIRNACRSLYKLDGWRGFWRGNLLGCLRLLPFSVIQVVGFNKLKLILSDDLGRLNGFRAIGAGMGAGAIANTITYPMDLIKTRLIIQPMDKTKSVYSGIVNAFSLTVRVEGSLALFRGLLITLIGSVPYSGVMFLSYETLDRLMPRPKVRHSVLETLAIGCVASATALTVTFPFDVIRRKLQASSRISGLPGLVDVSGRNAIVLATRIFHRYGPKGLWRGLIPALLRIVPYHGLLFVMYEACKYSCLYYNGYTSAPLLPRPRRGIDQNLEMDEAQDLMDHPENVVLDPEDPGSM